MDKPKWASEVQELSWEEAQLLRAMGAEVWFDFSEARCKWDTKPFSPNYYHPLPATESRRTINYIRKEEDCEPDESCDD